jgi:hypothetical protein
MNQEMKQDRKINIEDDSELRFWAVQLHVTRHELLDVIKQLGTNAVSRVKGHIETIEY